MLKRDFSKSNKQYFIQNKIALISVAVLLIVGLIIGACFGMNGNFELKGYNEFKVNINTEQAEEASKHSKEVSSIVNSYGAECDTVSIFDEGDNTILVVRYMNAVDANTQDKIDAEIATKLGISVDEISNHVAVGETVRAKDYVYTATAILLLITIASVFAAIRYNRASAITLIISCVLGTFGFMAIGAILRLKIGMSYFAMLVILNMLITYFAFDIFENIREENWLATNQYETAIESSMKKSRFRICAISVAVMVIGVLFVLLAPSALKYVSLNIMFMAVELLAMGWYVIPFVWSVFITICKKREYKVKATDVKEIKNKD